MFEIQFAAGKGKPVMMFPLREEAFQTAKYGPLTLDRQMADEMIANFQAGVLGTEPFIDEEHSEGASHGWVKDLYVDKAAADVAKKTGAKEALYAKIEWTPSGTKLLAEKAYRYISPWWGQFKDPSDGQVHSNVLMGAALCNNPVLRMMPAVELSDSRKLSETLRTSESHEIALAELEAEPANPIEELMADIADVESKVNEQIFGKKGAPQLRAFLKEVKTKLKGFKASEKEPVFGFSAAGEARLLDAGMSHNDIRDALSEAIKVEHPETPGHYSWIEDIFDDVVAYELETPTGKQTYRREYSIGADSTITLGEPEAVKKVISYEPEKVSDLHGETAKLSASSKQDKTANGGEDDMERSEMAKTLGLAEDATEEQVQAAVKKLQETATTDPDAKKLQETVEAQSRQLAEMQRKDLERQASEIASREIKGADGGTYRLSQPAQQIIREIILSESAGVIKLSERDGDDTQKETTVSLAGALDRLVENLTLVKMGETTRQESTPGTTDPATKLSELTQKKLSDNADLSYGEAFRQVCAENPDLAESAA